MAREMYVRIECDNADKLAILQVIAGGAMRGQAKRWQLSSDLSIFFMTNITCKYLFARPLIFFFLRTRPLSQCAPTPITTRRRRFFHYAAPAVPRVRSPSHIRPSPTHARSRVHTGQYPFPYLL
jgi:hypothetical protein